MKLNFAKKKMTKLIGFLCEIEFRYGGNEFRSCKIDSLFGKVELHVGDFPILLRLNSDSFRRNSDGKGIVTKFYYCKYLCECRY